MPSAAIPPGLQEWQGQIGLFSLLLQVKPALDAIRALGPILEDHLHMLLPALIRLINPTSTVTPSVIQEETLAAMQDLLPRMQLAGA